MAATSNTRPVYSLPLLLTALVGLAGAGSALQGRAAPAPTKQGAASGSPIVAGKRALASIDITTRGASAEAADNAPAIQKAINELQRGGGGTLLIPDGEFRFGNRLEITGDNITVKGNGSGSQLQQTNGSQWGFLVNGADRVKFQDFTLTGTPPANYPGTTHGIVFIGGTGHVAQGVTVRNFGSTGIRLTSKTTANTLLPPAKRVRGARVEDCTVEQCQTGISAFIGVSDTVILNCRTRRCWQVGIFVDDASTHDETVATACEDIHILDCEDSEVGFGNSRVAATGIAVTNTVRFSIVGCHISNGAPDAKRKGNGIVVGTQQYMNLCRNGAVIGNVVERPAGPGITIQGARDITLADNQVIDPGAGRQDANPALLVIGTVISGQQLGTPGLRLVGNQFVQKSGRNTANLVKIDSDSKDALVTDNVVQGDSGASLSGIGAAQNQKPLSKQGRQQFYRDTFSSLSSQSAEQGPVFLTQTTSLSGTQRVIFLDSSNGAFSVKLPDATQQPGREYIFKRIRGTETVTLRAAEGQSVKDAPSLSVSSETVRLVATENGWNLQ